MTGKDETSVTTAGQSSVFKVVPYLDRACDLLWQSGHPLVAEQLMREVEALFDRCTRFEAVLFPTPETPEEES